jgi:hypothetical protein
MEHEMTMRMMKVREMVRMMDGWNSLVVEVKVKI